MNGFLGSIAEVGSHTMYANLPHLEGAPLEGGPRHLHAEGEARVAGPRLGQRPAEGRREPPRGEGLQVPVEPVLEYLRDN